ncbi:hypothetical protein HED60_18005 [Planctomycetales bacterium ZRK34]|nr:hypothetical protein HED60_18005 [Planctomycetales bacterium ZRK34]
MAEQRFCKPQVGNHQRSNAKYLQLSKTKIAAQGAADDLRSVLFDSDLAALIEAWPTLPAAIKAGIVAMLKAVHP